jgi:hypothetical protein
MKCSRSILIFTGTIAYLVVRFIWYVKTESVSNAINQRWVLVFQVIWHCSGIESVQNEVPVTA